MTRTPLDINSGDTTEEDPLLVGRPSAGEQRVNAATSSVLSRMRAVLHTIEAEEVQATVSIPHDKEEYFDDKPPVPHLGLPSLEFEQLMGFPPSTAPNILPVPSGETNENVQFTRL
jgi:hypothetical protein